jgi:hypothetical protein
LAVLRLSAFCRRCAQCVQYKHLHIMNDGLR